MADKDYHENWSQQSNTDPEYHDESDNEMTDKFGMSKRTSNFDVSMGS